MKNIQVLRMRSIAAAVCGLVGVGAHAVTFELGDVRGSFDSTITVGTGIRASNPDCNLVVGGATGSGAPAGCLAPTAAYGDQGNLNYQKGRPFTTYLKGSHELLLKAPDDLTFMTRFNWLRDVSSTHTTGFGSAAPPPPAADGLSDDARKDLRFKARLLDFWVSKSFDIGGKKTRVRVGNQVISWGESLFLPGGINTTNAVDIMRLSQPGTQLKEAVLPAPIVSVTSNLGSGVSVEGYVQSNWNANYFPPTGAYWSTANGLGKGHDAYGLVETKPKNGGQGGVSLRYQPSGTELNLGLYAMAYHDKAPSFSLNAKDTGAVGWVFPEKRQLYGVSANMPVGDWALGTELSYRPKDAVPLNAAVSGCSSQNGNCWVDEKKLQWHLTGILSLTPSTGRAILDVLGAQTATLLAEAVVVHYPNLKQSYGGDPISAGAWGWGQEFSPTGTPIPKGTKTSSGFNFDFSWVYDGTLVPGWQVIPEIYYFQALSGRTPNAAAQFMSGAKSAALIMSFVKNPANWQGSISYTKFFGGREAFDQPLRDRDFFALTLSRNF